MKLRHSVESATHVKRNHVKEFRAQDWKIQLIYISDYFLHPIAS